MAKIPSPVMGNGSFPDDMVTLKRFGVRRLQVDSQQTSFEDNREFRFFYPIDVPYTEDVVFKTTISSGSAMILFLRKLSLYSGGRTYRVYTSDMDFTFTGTFGDPLPIIPMNAILNEYNQAHPDTGVTIQVATGAGIFTQGSDAPLDGLDVLTDGNTNRASKALDAEAEKIGYTPSELYVHLKHIGGNNQSIGYVKLCWEELFND